MIDLHPKNILNKIINSLHEPYILNGQLETTLRLLYVRIPSMFDSSSSVHKYKIGGSFSLTHACLINRPIHDLDIIINMQRINEDEFVSLYMLCEASKPIYEQDADIRLAAIEQYNKIMKIGIGRSYIGESICENGMSPNTDNPFSDVEQKESYIEYAKQCSYCYRLNLYYKKMLEGTNKISAITPLVNFFFVCQEEFPCGNPFVFDNMTFYVANPIEALRAKLSYLYNKMEIYKDDATDEELESMIKRSYVYKHYLDLKETQDMLNDVFGDDFND